MAGKTNVELLMGREKIEAVWTIDVELSCQGNFLEDRGCGSARVDPTWTDVLGDDHVSR